MPKTPLGLKERILQAKSLKSIDTLLKEGKTYANASPTTQRAWVRAAERRRAALAK